MVASEFEGPFFPARKWFFKHMIRFGRWRARRGASTD
jgi:hypothetical protein